MKPTWLTNRVLGICSPTLAAGGECRCGRCRRSRCDQSASGLRIVGWGPFRMPGERRRMRKAQEHAEEMMRAMKELRGRDV